MRVAPTRKSAAATPSESSPPTTLRADRDPDGSQFDSSKGRAPFDFTLGQGMVIKGWDNGLLDMCVGEKRKLIIPSGLGYGAGGSGAKIPGGSTLVFETELLAIKN